MAVAPIELGKRVLTSAGLFAAALWAGSATVPESPGADPNLAVAQRAARELPDPLRMENGERIHSAAQWPARREEMKRLLLEHEYGTMPADSGGARLLEASAWETLNDGATRHRVLTLGVGPQRDIPFAVDAYYPAQGEGPYPAIVRIGRGCPVIEEVNARGYALFCFAHRDLDPDVEGGDTVGPVQAAYPGHTWGSVAVWAWGASRVLDHLEAAPEIRADKVIVTGHSRTGKAALLAGALDERFAMVVPNGSGCSGASAYRVYTRGCETLELIARPARFASWFQPNLHDWSYRERELPYDQHFLRALVAPRPVLATEADDDIWANPLGAIAAWQAAQPVYDWLGAPDRSAIHYRPGQHDQLDEDIRALLDFADRHLRGQDTGRAFNVLPARIYTQGPDDPRGANAAG